MLGFQMGVYFFPDSCEIANYNIKAGGLRRKNKKDNYSNTNNNYNEYATDLLESPPHKPKDVNPYANEIDEVKNSLGVEDRVVDDIVDRLPEGFDEGGLYNGIGVNIEYARYVGGSQIAGEANARSFKGIFHTIELALYDQSASVYVGAEKWTNGNWIGGTYSPLGYGNGVASVDWDYQLGKIFDLDKDGSSIGTCICRELIRLMPTLP